MSRKFLDRPLSSIDTANYWTEYVIRYGSDVLRSPAMDMAWWQVALIDVIGFLLLCAIVVIAAVAFVVRLLMRTMSHHDSSGSKKTN